MGKMGTGNKAIAEYVRRNHPEILDTILNETQARMRAKADHARAKQAANVEARKAAKAARLVAEITALGFNVSLGGIVKQENGVRPVERFTFAPTRI